MKKIILVLPMVIALASCAAVSSSKISASKSAYDACLDRSEDQILSQYSDLGLTGATNVRHACEQIVEKQ